MQPPDVEFLDSLHPAQSASVKIINSLGVSCHANMVTIVSFHRRYLPIRLSCFHDPSVGALMVLANSFTANDMSGLSAAR